MRPFVQSGHIHKTPLKLWASSLFYLTHLLHLYHQLFIDVKRENILCVLDLVSFIKILATINLYYFQFEWSNSNKTVLQHVSKQLGKPFSGFKRAEEFFFSSKYLWKKNLIKNKNKPSHNTPYVSQKRNGVIQGFL